MEAGNSLLNSLGYLTPNAAPNAEFPTQAGEELRSPSESDLERKGPLTRKQIEEFFDRGVVLVPGLLQGELLDSVREVRNSMATMMTSETYSTVASGAWNQHKIFEDLALRSPIAAAAEQLTPPSERGGAGDKPLRVLRDAFFALSPGNKGCGWHVDDAFFWPAKRDGPGPGVNVWVALDEVELGAGGGLAYAPGSHRPGFLPHRDVIRQPGEGPQTCKMETLSPECHAALEAIKECPAFQPGDAVIHTRFLFHRGDPFAASDGRPVARYSVRYVPATCELDGMNFVMTPEGEKKPVMLSGVRICDAGAEHGHFPPTEVGEEDPTSYGA